MYGVRFDFLRDYVIEKHGGESTWKALLKVMLPTNSGHLSYAHCA